MRITGNVIRYDLLEKTKTEARNSKGMCDTYGEAHTRRLLDAAKDGAGERAEVRNFNTPKNTFKEKSAGI